MCEAVHFTALLVVILVHLCCHAVDLFVGEHQVRCEMSDKLKSNKCRCSNVFTVNVLGTRTDCLFWNQHHAKHVQLGALICSQFDDSHYMVRCEKLRSEVAFAMSCCALVLCCTRQRWDTCLILWWITCAQRAKSGSITILSLFCSLTEHKGMTAPIVWNSSLLNVLQSNVPECDKWKGYRREDDRACTEICGWTSLFAVCGRDLVRPWRCLTVFLPFCWPVNTFPWRQDTPPSILRQRLLSWRHTPAHGGKHVKCPSAPVVTDHPKRRRFLMKIVQELNRTKIAHEKKKKLRRYLIFEPLAGVWLSQ